MSKADRTMEGIIHFRTGAHGKKTIKDQKRKVSNVPQGKLPRVTKFMALAIKWEGLLKKGIVKDYADLARLGNVSRARVTQIMNLRLLAPAIQEKLLFHKRVRSNKDTVKLKALQAVALEADWGRQLALEV